VKISNQICRISSLIVTGKGENESMEIAVTLNLMVLHNIDRCLVMILVLVLDFSIHLILPAALWP
jgi:hypothetical protein